MGRVTTIIISIALNPFSYIKLFYNAYQTFAIRRYMWRAGSDLDAEKNWTIYNVIIIILLLLLYISRRNNPRLYHNAHSRVHTVRYIRINSAYYCRTIEYIIIRYVYAMSFW